jgi:hypothetical protein
LISGPHVTMTYGQDDDFSSISARNKYRAINKLIVCTDDCVIVAFGMIRIEG